MYKKIKAMPVVLAIALMMTGCQSGDENLAKKDYSPLKYVTLGEYKAVSYTHLRAHET